MLAHIGVKPGGSLVGFNADDARILLESLDWVADAEVRRTFPNPLEVTLNEREPFAIWQMDGNYAVIDREGVEMSGLNPCRCGIFRWFRARAQMSPLPTTLTRWKPYLT